MYGEISSRPQDDIPAATPRRARSPAVAAASPSGGRNQPGTNQRGTEHQESDHFAAGGAEPFDPGGLIRGRRTLGGTSDLRPVDERELLNGGGRSDAGSS